MGREQGPQNLLRLGIEGQLGRGDVCFPDEAKEVTSENEESKVHRDKCKDA